MNISEKKTLCELIDETVEILQLYETATKPIIEVDFDEIGRYLDERTELMEKLRDIVKRENEIISVQPDADALGKIFRLEALDKTYDGETGELAKKLKAENILYRRIEALEMQVEERLAEERKRLDRDFVQVSKTKRVIDYMEYTAKPAIFRGSTFDTSQ